MGLLGDAALTALYGFVFQELLSILKGDLGLPLDISSELKKVNRKLLQIQALLIDAERRYTEPGVNIWQDDLRDLAYDMDDIIDEVKTRRLELERAARNQDEVRSLLSIASNRVKKLWSDVGFNKALKQKINEVLARLEEVEKYANELGLRGNSSGLHGRVSPTRLRPETSPSVDETEVYGREKDKESVIELLFAPASDQNKKNYSVVSIVGMGGVGKTTLAQLVFNDERVKSEFNMRSWACVSDVFNVAKVTKELIEYSTGQNNCSDMALPALQKRLEEEVSGKKFLLVFDDIWTVKECDCMKAPLNRCAKGSIILVTTRDKAIAIDLSNTPPYELGTLDEEQCWSLFKDKAFRDVYGHADEHLFKLGKEIVKKCKGVPLAVKVLGAMLQGAEPERWKAVLKNELWSLENDEIFPALRVSYHYLPSPLKCCFEYFSLFPTDYYFNEEELVLMWIGEGFVEAKKDRQLEDIGRQFFNDLKRRCLMQTNNQIHDLAHSLACAVSGDIYCRLSSDRRSCKSLERARHASLLGEDEEIDFRVLEKAEGLRTILQFGYFSHGLMDKLSGWRFLRVVKLQFTKTSKLRSFISDLKHMRYLDISFSKDIMDLLDAVCELYNLQYLNVHGCGILENIPKDVGNLLNLRHLDLSWTRISSLPQSICKLHNLQVLNLWFCKGLTHLPEDIGDLISLRHLRLSCMRISSLPQSICKLYNLQVLNLELCKELTRLPEDIGDLCSLMSLNILGTNIRSLPDSIVKATNLQYIDPDRDIGGLPPYFGKLTSLQRMEVYPIGKEIGQGIGELKDMNNLKGDLFISNLENVDNVEEAKLANLKSKKNISGLGFKWSPLRPEADDNDNSVDDGSEDDNDSLVVRDGELEVKVLEALEPHPSALTDLSFENYSGERFPKWMSMMSFSLKILKMRGLGRIRKLVDVELPSLETLEIYKWPRLKEIYMSTPKLIHLEVSACQEVTKICLLPSIRDSNCYISSWIELPQLEKVQLEKCPRLKEVYMALPELTSLVVGDCRKLTKLIQIGNEFPKSQLRFRIFSCVNLKDISISAHVEKLDLKSLPSLTSLLYSKASMTQEYAGCSNRGLIPQFPALRIEECEQLRSLAIDEPPPPSLKMLKISNCGKLESLFQQHLSALEVLWIEGCEQLRYLPKGLYKSSLQKLYIYNCPQVEARPDDQVPPSLQHLHVYFCPKLEQQLQDEDRRDWLALGRFSGAFSALMSRFLCSMWTECAEYLPLSKQ